MREGRGGNLSRSQFDAVMKRAAELAARSVEVDDSDVHFSDAEILRIGREVGLPERHVRAALAEVRGGGPIGRTLLDRTFGNTRVEAVRLVRGSPQSIGRELDSYFGGTLLFEPLRRTPTFLHYRPRQDLLSKITRTLRFETGTPSLVSARGVDVTLEPTAEESTSVAIVAEPDARAGWIVGAAALGGGLGLVLAAGVVAASMAWIGIPLAPALIGGGATMAASVVVAARSLGGVRRRGLTDLTAKIEGVLDRLEQGEPLDPPPPIWNRWIRRRPERGEGG